MLRIVHVLRKGPRARKLQAWVGLLLVLVALGWLIYAYLWRILLIACLALFGFLLLRRSLREPPPPSA